MNGAMSQSAAPMYACVIVESHLDAALARQRGEALERLSRLGHLRTHVWRRRVAPVARLEEPHAAARGGLQQWARKRHARRGQVRRDHRDLHALCGEGVNCAREILGRALRQHVAARPDGEVHAVEPGLLDRAAEVAPVELWQVLREKTEHARGLGAGRRLG